MKSIFQRYEKKYLMTKTMYEAFLEATKNDMCMDNYGKHTICNIYYDTYDHELIRASIEKPKYKEKLRLRSYGVPSQENKVYLELKKKYKGIVYKRRVSLTLAEAEAYLNEGIKPSKENQILREIDYFIALYQPEPKLYLAYDREAYYGREDPNVRITFDHHIRSREVDLSLSKGDKGHALLDETQYLMEIKVEGAMPIWLCRILSELEIYPTSFSKYGTIYKQSILNKQKDQMEIKEFIQLCQLAAFNEEEEKCLQVY